jgi:hypothetical protein
MTIKPDPAYASANVLTLLTAKGTKLTKTITRAGEKQPADEVKLFTHDAEPVEDLADLYGLLRWLNDKIDTIIVRPAVLEGAPDVIRRISTPSSDPKRPRCLIDIRRYWLMIDIDKLVIRFPRGWRRNPERYIRRLIKKALPEAFHGAGVIAQFSSGMSADGGEPRVHLWFWLDVPLISIAANRWLKDCPIDDTIYNRGQPHFTAAPIFEDGVDPLGEQRLVFMPGPVVEVPECIDTSAPEEIDVDLSVDLSRYVNPDFGDTSWKLWLPKMGDHDGGDGFHLAIRNVTINYVRQNYNPQSTDPVGDLDYPRLEQAILDHARTIKGLSPKRQADLDDRLRKMKPSFRGAVPKVQHEIRKRGFIATPPLPPARTGSLAEMMARASSEAQDGV